MAGKSKKGKNRKRMQKVASNSSGQVVSSNTPSNGSLNGGEANGDSNLNESVDAKSEMNRMDQYSQQPPAKQAADRLYPVSVKTQGGEKLELRLSPGDSVVDVKLILLDAPCTCFYTCYELLLHTKDGAVHNLEHYNEISEAADITSGGCFLEMIPALYDDRSIRIHVHRTRELLSLSTLHSSMSTTLVLQNAMRRNASANMGDPVKVEVPELENIGFIENVNASLSDLLSSPSKEIKCVESIVFSSFNPPPSYRRLSGDLIYLDVVTLEGNTYCITGTSKAFYVNASTGNVLDPRPNKAASEATSLVGLLQKISPKFKKAFLEIMEHKASLHPFEKVHPMLPLNSWLGTYPVPDHKRDSARAENSSNISFGCETIGMPRDWNEELQTFREFPHDTQQENGAIGVVSRCIPSINPNDPEYLQMYVHHNIFFTRSFDADLEKLPRKHALEESSKVAVNALLQNHTQYSDSSMGNLNGMDSLSPDLILESNLAETERATYASANNDLKGTKALQEADVPGLYTLAMAIIDYRGHRVVAQSILPGILQGDKSDALQYGSVDNGKKICYNEEFHSKVLEAAKHLHLKEHTLLDGAGNVVKLAAPVECKGIVGSDDRHYLLDLVRLTPLDANCTGTGSRYCILRPELVTAFCDAKDSEKSKHEHESKQENPVASDSSEITDAEEGANATDEVASAATNAQDTDKDDVQEFDSGCSRSKGGRTSEGMLFNPNVLTKFRLNGNPEEIAADEENVLNASLYLKDVALPKFIEALCTLDVLPMDGQTLTEALHAHGINVRYIGTVAEGVRHMPHLWDLCSNEIVVRSSKHIVKEILRDAEDHNMGHAISHFLNCFVGKVQSASTKGLPKGKQPKNNKRVHSEHASGYAGKKRSLYLNITSDRLWSDIQEFAKLKYQFELPDDARERVKKVSVIRNFCQKVGITIAARKYEFGALAPFQVADILDLKPVVKHSIPVFSETRELVNAGKVQLKEGKVDEACAIFSEAFAILQQVTGPMHREVANCCRNLATAFYHAGDLARAIIQQHNELIINERCLGLDHPDTAHSYGNLALFYQGLNQTELALHHMLRALLLLGLSSSPDHPDVAGIFLNVAMMYKDVGKMDTALRYLQEALKKNKKFLGEDHVQTAVCYHALAMAFDCIGAYKLSHQHEKRTYDIFVKRFGEDNPRTKEHLNWMNMFKMRELQMNAQKQKGQALDTESTQKAIDMLKANPDLIHEFQAGAGTPSNSSSVANSTFNNAAIGEALPRGRGVDEQAAQAAVQVQPHGISIQATPPPTQLLNIINSDTTSEAGNKANGGIEKENNSASSSNGV